ncbi:MAG: ATP-dependent Clp protease proteolytic subunit, partial [Bacteroidota bacterium]
MNYGKEFRQYATQHHGLATPQVDRHLHHSAGALRRLRGFTPSVMEERQLNVVQMDVFSRLMMDRIIFLGVGVDDYVANVIQAQLLFLQSLDPQKDIQMYINS